MAAHTVNLDALIPREDFGEASGKAGGQLRTTLSLSDLGRNGFFQNSLRKPDFQRETTHWTPPKVVDLIKAFLDRDLIPAVILWERGEEVFVIDGAHRLSALIAWIRDDYGDAADSNKVFGAGLTDEQRNVAKRTRDLIKREIGTFAEFSGLVGQQVSDPVKSRRLAAMGKEALIIQWVTATTTKAAEDSFFKINQAAQPIDPVERRILQSRGSPRAIAARCIARGGRGHKYWAGFDQATSERVEQLGGEIYDILYRPPHKQPVTSTDQPIAGLGYNALPFVFDLISLCNNLSIPNTANAKIVASENEPDRDGSKTIAMLQCVLERLKLVSTNDPSSLGLHPLVYFYARSGNFLPVAFLASLEFAARLKKVGRRKDFTAVRRQFEEFLFEHKAYVSLTITRLGSGSRSLQRIEDLFWQIFTRLHGGDGEQKIISDLIETPDYSHLKQADFPAPRADLPPSERGASRQSKSAAFISQAMESPVRCSICQAAVHSNSITFDHDKRRSEGGANYSSNLAAAHPFCNSGFKG